MITIIHFNDIIGPTFNNVLSPIENFKSTISKLCLFLIYGEHDFQLLRYSHRVVSTGSYTFEFLCQMPFLIQPQRDLCHLRIEPLYFVNE